MKTGKNTLEVMQKARVYNDWLFAFFKPYLGRKVLEIGAGIGTFTKKFSQTSEIWAIDINETYLKKLKKIPNVKSGWGDIEKDKYFFKRQKFDAAVSLNVFEHIKNDAKAFENTLSLLKDGGFFVCLVPAHKALYGSLDKPLGHYRRYDKPSLERKLKKSGFKILKVRYLNVPGALGWFLSGKILRKKIIPKGQLSLFDKILTPFLFFEALVDPPFGLSVLVVAQKPPVEKVKKLSIIIPVYNEEKTVRQVIQKVKKARLPGNLKREIVVVNDASTDKSGQLLEKIRRIKLLRHKKNQGKGAAVKTGFATTSGEIIIIQDADLEYDPTDYKKLLVPIISGRADVVYGTRLKDYPVRFLGPKHTPFLSHYLGNKFLSWITSFLYGAKISDMETCYKVFRKNVLDGLIINAKRFDFEPEFTAKILKKGYKVHEVPIRVKPRGYDEGKKITWQDGFAALWTLIKYRFIN